MNSNQEIHTDNGLYIGKTLLGQPNGNGIFHYSNGEHYYGNFNIGIKNGQGIMIYPDNSKYEGRWENDKRNGQGTMIYSNGDKYEGRWENDKRNGTGKMLYSNDNIYEGIWYDDEPMDGFIIYKNGERKKVTNKIITDMNNDTNDSKPDELKSVKIKNQYDFSTCWAHAISRNFVRTFQILGVIKSEYIEDFYDLFYVILTENVDCHIGENTDKMFYLLDYLKKNYKKNIFDINYGRSLCNLEYLKVQRLSKKILENIKPDDKCTFIKDLDYLFSNDKLLFIGKQMYDTNTNKPTKAIKTMLYYKLQPCVCMYFNKYIYENLQNPSNIFPSVQLSEFYDNSCIGGKYKTPGHIVNLRRWTINGIELKNSWGSFFSNNGNFSVPDLKYLICEEHTTIEFISLMFDYNNINIKYKNIINNKLCSYWKTFDESLKIKELTNYEGSYNVYGLCDGKGEMRLSNGNIYSGDWVDGFMSGKGEMRFSNGDIYSGDWVNDNMFGKGEMIYLNGDIYDGEWYRNMKNGKGKMVYLNGDIYKGTWINDIPLCERKDLSHEGNTTHSYKNKYTKYKLKYLKLKKDYR